MSTEAIHLAVENQNLPSGSFVLHYDFSNYVGKTPNIYTPSLADQQYSGELVAYPSYVPTNPIVERMQFIEGGASQDIILDTEMPSDFTFMGWINQSNTTQEQNPFGNERTNGVLGFRVIVVLDRLQARMVTSNGSALAQTTSGTITTGEQIHIAYRHRSSDGLGELLINGVTSPSWRYTSVSGEDWKKGDMLTLGYVENTKPLLGNLTSGYLFGQFLSNEEISGVAFDYSFAEKALTGNLNVARFSGGYNDANQYIKVTNSNQIYPENYRLQSDSFTNVFRASHLTRFDIGEEIQLPLNNKDAVFSNVTGDGNCVSGWEFGLNSCNKLYFKTTSLNEPTVFSYDDGVYGDNIWHVRYSNPFVTLSRYEPYDDSIQKRTFALPEALSNGGIWTLGSGRGILPIDDSINNGQTSALELRDFMFISQYVSDAGLRDISLAMLGIKESGSSSVNFSISGIDTAIYSGSGINYTFYNSGTFSGFGLSATGSIFINRAIELTGSVPQFSPYFSRLQEISGLSSSYLNEPEWIYQTLVNTGTAITGITGLNYVSQEVLLSGIVPVYYPTLVSGQSGSGLSVIYNLTGASQSINTDSFSIGGYDRSPMYPKSLSFLGQRQTGDFVEIISLTTGQENVNIFAGKRNSSVYEGQTLTLNAEENPSGLNLFINGIAYRHGDLTVTTQNSSIVTDSENPSVFYQVACDGVTSGQITESFQQFSNFRNVDIGYEKDYGITGGREIVFVEKFTNLTESNNLFGIYDVNQQLGKRGELVITGLNQYADAPFYTMPTSGRQIFFNGQKMYKGINYEEQPEIDGALYVLGAGIENINGLYYQSGTINGKPRYEHERGGTYNSLIFWTNLFGGKWRIQDTGFIVRYDSVDTGVLTPDLVQEWMAYSSGSIPEVIKYDSPLYPSGYVTGLTGIFFSFPEYSGVSTSGISSFDIYLDSSFIPKSKIAFINGVRTPISTFIEHDLSKDLISGVRISVTGVSELASSRILA